MKIPIERLSLFYRMPLDLKYVVILCTIIKVIIGGQFIINEESEIQKRAYHFKVGPNNVLRRKQSIR